MLGLVLAGSMVISMISPADAASKMRISKKKVTIAKGEKVTLKVKKATKKVKWSVTKGKKVVTLSKKKKTSVVVTGKKAGKAVVTAKAGKKKATCKITVTAAKKNQATQAPEATTTVTAAPASQTPAATAKASAAPTASVAPTATAAPTATVAPTATAAPTATVAPTATAEPTATVAPTATAAPTATVAPTATAAPTKEPVKGDPVENVVVDMSKIAEKTFSASPAKIDLSGVLDDRFDLSYFDELKIGYTMEINEAEDIATITGGKFAVAATKDDLNGYNDGVAFTYNMTADGTTSSIDLSDDKVSGQAFGINIQPMDSNQSYGWPAALKSITITSLEFVAKEGACYPGDGEAKPTPKPTTAPEFESSEFHYDGLDQTWIDANIDPSKPVVAMSFDDGPGSYNGFVDYGMQIQKALTEAGAHATFFYIGQHIEHDEDSRNEVIAAKEAGFEVANHSYDSDGLNGKDADVVKEKIAKTDALLKELTGYEHFLFRAPNVAYSQTMFAVIEKPFIDVSVWSNDYQSAVDKDKIVENVTKDLKDGAIINMHSVHEKTAQAVPEILQYCKENGIQVVSVSELFAIKGKKLMTGVKYFNAN